MFMDGKTQYCKMPIPKSHLTYRVNTNLIKILTRIFVLGQLISKFLKNEKIKNNQDIPKQ